MLPLPVTVLSNIHFWNQRLEECAMIPEEEIGKKLETEVVSLPVAVFGI